MKKVLILLLTLLLTFSFIGCSSSSITGSWENDQDIVEFKSDGTFSASYYWLPGDYEVSGNKLTITSPMLGKEEYEFEIVGDTLNLKSISENGAGDITLKKH